MNLFEEFRRSIVTMTIEEEGPEIRGADTRANLGRLLPWTGLANVTREEDENQKEELGLLHS